MSKLAASEGGIAQREMLQRQGELILKLDEICREIRSSKGTIQKKNELLMSFLNDESKGLSKFAPLALPIEPGIFAEGICSEKCSIFKSQLNPFKVVFKGNEEYSVIFKVGDDLRQDQLIVQMIKLMDRLMKNENLDLKLTPYKVLATGLDQGMVQFVKSYTLSSILADYNNNLQLFLKTFNTDLNSPSTFFIAPIAMDNYVRSCAGYCVITYLLGVGDRHLDNLLLTPAGNLFHIDFGFILGRDPKPFPPPMKLCKEMVEAMGGATSVHYQKFKSFCFIAFNILRKHANLILNLFSLMIDANIRDIAIEPDKAISKVSFSLISRFKINFVLI